MSPYTGGRRGGAFGARRSRGFQENPGKRKTTANLGGVCATCLKPYTPGTLIVMTFEHDRCPGADESATKPPSVLDGLTR